MNPYFFAVRECEIGECAKGDSPQLHIEKACELTVSNGSRSRYLAWKASRVTEGNGFA